MAFRKHTDPRLNLIFRLIDKMPLPPRRAFARALARRTELLPDFMLIEEPEIAPSMESADRFFHKFEEFVQIHRPLKEKNQRRRKCTEAKQEITRERNQLIDKLIDKDGFSQEDHGEAIYKHLLEHHDHLLKIKRPTGNRKYTAKESMWKCYQRYKGKQG